jgi:hypothetical protein
MTCRRLLAAALGAAVALGALSGALAQAAPEGITATAAFRESSVTIGDAVVLVVRVEHSDRVVVSVPLPAIEGAAVRNSGETTTTGTPDGTQVTETTFRYQLFTLGAVSAAPVSIRWIDEAGESGAFEIPGPQVTVVSVRAPGDEALRPLKPPLEVAGAPPAWVVPGGVALLVLVLLALGAVIVRRLRRRVPEAEQEALDVPERSARERLASVQHAGLPDEAEFQRFYGTIASVVREYLGERFGFNATALTSSELETRMTGHGVDRWQARLVSGLLERCDRAVYARHYPDPESADHDLTVAFEIVELSRPQPPKPSEADEREAVAS